MSTPTNHDIQLALRTAAGHERAALQAEAQAAKTYEMKMVSAGASAFHAFELAMKAAPEFQGRQIDEKAVRRHYESTKPRPWWDKHLAAVRVNGSAATREWGKRLIQWHIDPEAAKARRARRIADDTARRKVQKVKTERAARQTQGPRGPQVTRAEANRVVAASTSTAIAGRELPRLELAEVHATAQDCLGEVNRIKSALAKLKEPAQFDNAVELLKAAARELEKL
jgi:hypothetical protein